jgi:hypothetical protein
LQQIIIKKKLDLPVRLKNKLQEVGSNWLGSIDNNGTKVALHYTPDFSFKESQSSKMTLQIPVYFWINDEIKCLDMGKVCSDEILEISFD